MNAERIGESEIIEGGGISPEFSVALKKIEKALLLKEDELADFIESHREKFEKLVAEHPEILDLYEENSVVAEAWLKENLLESE